MVCIVVADDVEFIVRRICRAADSDVFDRRGHFFCYDVGSEREIFAQFFERIFIDTAFERTDDVQIGVVDNFGLDRVGVQAVIENLKPVFDRGGKSGCGGSHVVETVFRNGGCNTERGTAVFCEYELDGRIDTVFCDGEIAFFGIGSELERQDVVVVCDIDVVFALNGTFVSAAEHNDVV